MSDIDLLCINTIRTLAMDAVQAAESGHPGTPMALAPLAYTLFICSDGDLMEGISHEACSFAGHYKFPKLIGFYDDNRITIDGSTDLSFSDDTAKRFEGYGWQVLHIADVNDLASIDKAVAD